MQKSNSELAEVKLPPKLDRALGEALALLEKMDKQLF
jgi:hypothetical protein